MKTPTTAALSLALAMLATGPARADDKPTGDLAKLQGKWTTHYGADKNVTVHLTIEGSNCTATFINASGGGGVAMSGKVAVDEAAKPHKTIDFTGFKRPNGEEIGPNLGIYVIVNDDTVKFCSGGPGKPRPTEFKAGEEGGPELVVLEREGSKRPGLRVEGSDMPAATGAATPAAKKSDLAKFQGRWTGKGGPEKNFGVDVVFKDGTVEAKVTTPDGQEFKMSGEFSLNENARPHKTIDWKNFKGPNGDDVQDNPGIYAFEGDDTLKVCNGGPGKERPTEFKAGDDESPQLFVLKRAPAEKETPRPKPETPDAAGLKGDLAKFQGEWTGKAGPERNIEISVTFKDHTATIHFTTPDGEERTMKGEADVDETAKPHPAITFKGFTRPDGTPAPENRGIYAFEGSDAVKVCNGGPGNDRPTEFKAGDGGPPQLIELKRKK